MAAHTHLMPAPERQTQVDLWEFNVNLVYIVSSSLGQPDLS